MILNSGKNLSETIRENEEQQVLPRFLDEEKEAEEIIGPGEFGRMVETLRRTLRGSLLENSRHVRGGAIVAPRNTVGQVTRIISGEARNTGQLD